MTLDFAVNLSEMTPIATRIHKVPVVGWELFREHIYLYNVPAEFVGAWVNSRKRQGKMVDDIQAYAVLKRFKADFYMQLVYAEEREKFLDLWQRSQPNLPSELVEVLSKHPDYVEGSPRDVALELLAEIETFSPGYKQGAWNRIEAHNEFMRGNPELMLFMAKSDDLVDSQIIPYSVDVWEELADKFSRVFRNLLDTRFK